MITNCQVQCPFLRPLVSVAVVTTFNPSNPAAAMPTEEWILPSGGLTVTDGVRGGRALGQLGLGLLVADGAGQAGVQGALPVRVGVVQTLLAHRVAVVLAVQIHASARRAHRARLAPTRYGVQEVVVVADADGVVGVGAGRLHPHQAGAERAGRALLRVAVVLREGLTCRAEERGAGQKMERAGNREVNSRINSQSNEINHVYRTFVRGGGHIDPLGDICSKGALVGRRVL